jgi:hypothetical protein
MSVTFAIICVFNSTGLACAAPGEMSVAIDGLENLG